MITFRTEHVVLLFGLALGHVLIILNNYLLWQDTAENIDIVDFSIEFLPEDLLPPIFNEDLYYSNISS